ncbi:hypothetical protein BCV70DRAFT_192963 [Testicularia cyperi]|uniref:PAN2-PAN3 deadenylation complex subunit PAN3 n=1 Tax=Testicularia cyperi TaxID=1882483 RepID=A0A317XM51_9BASI|nr:hypothetical protein BCV70DRAFT_192963 [Testicularia cyperi]
MYQYPNQNRHGAQSYNGALPQRPNRSAAIPIVAPNTSAVQPKSPNVAHSQAESAKSPNAAHANAVANRKPCRNIAIYGNCKYENDGCPFDHTAPSAISSHASPIPPSSGLSASSAASPVNSPNKMRAAAPPMTASPLKGGLSARNVGAAVFVPKSTGGSSPALSASSAVPMQNRRAAQTDDVASGVQDMAIDPPKPRELSSAAFASGRLTPSSSGYEQDSMSSSYDPPYATSSSAMPYEASFGMQNSSATPTPQSHQQHPHQQQQPPPPQQQQQQSAPPPPRAFNPYEHMNEFGDPAPTGAPPGLGLGSGMDFYTSGATSKLRQPLQYHLYAPPLPHVSNLHPHHLSANAFFLNPNQREELQRKQEAMHASVPPPELGGPNLPDELHVYHSLVPLEHPGPSAPASMGMPPGLIDPRMGAPGASGATGASGDHSRIFGYRSHSYKATCTLDGKRYVLRRLEGFRLQHETAISLVERWRRIRHPSIVSVREAFTTRAFGDQSIVFVYDYHPLSSTLYAEHMTIKAAQPDRRTGRMQPVSMQIPERTLWSYLCQLASALRSIHGSGLAARCIESSKILRTGKNRVRINCCSVFDVIAYDPDNGDEALRMQQLEDMTNLGALILSVGLNSVSAINDVPASLASIGGRYSQELKKLLSWLLGQTEGPTRNVDELFKMLGTHLVDEMDSALNYNDLLDNSLMKELENGRLVRLMCKLGFINERPEFDHDPRWAETGDRYVIKLFRDHVFHAVDEAGRPVVDLSHILTNLNKLDAGADEKIMLTSRDEHSCLVVSYREIKNCVENAFQDLSRTR